MLLIEHFLVDDRLNAIRRLCDAAAFEDGGYTGGTAGRLIKNNLQGVPTDPKIIEADKLVRDSLLHSEDLQSFALPYIVTPIRFARYGPGMRYGNHVDAAVQNVPGAILRTDISFTIFLSEPEDYDGGELVIDVDGATRQVKGKAGDMIVYGTGVVHRVNEVTRGVRAVAIGWIQSLVADHTQRKILHEILMARTNILQTSGRNADFERLNWCYINLQRIWANP